MIGLGPVARRRRMSLTPMIDVVFLLLIFFMLAARFGQDGMLALSGAPGGTGEGWQGPPRLVEFAPDGLFLNGAPIAPEALPEALGALMPDPGAAVVLRPRAGAALQDLVDLAGTLQAAGFARLILVEP